MSFSPDPASPRFSEKLTAAKIKKFTSLILRSEHPRTSDAVIAPLLELVSDVEGCMYSERQQLPVSALSMCSQLGWWSFRYVCSSTLCLEVMVVVRV